MSTNPHVLDTRPIIGEFILRLAHLRPNFLRVFFSDEKWVVQTDDAHGHGERLDIVLADVLRSCEENDARPKEVRLL